MTIKKPTKQNTTLLIALLLTGFTWTISADDAEEQKNLPVVISEVYISGDVIPEFKTVSYHIDADGVLEISPTTWEGKKEDIKKRKVPRETYLAM